MAWSHMAPGKKQEKNGTTKTMFMKIKVNNQKYENYVTRIQAQAEVARVRVAQQHTAKVERWHNNNKYIPWK